MSWPDFVDDWVKVLDRAGIPVTTKPPQGTRLYIMGDPLTSLPAARSRLAVIFWTETFIQVMEEVARRYRWRRRFLGGTVGGGQEDKEEEVARKCRWRRRLPGG